MHSVVFWNRYGEHRELARVSILWHVGDAYPNEPISDFVCYCSQRETTSVVAQNLVASILNQACVAHAVHRNPPVKLHRLTRLDGFSW